MLGYVFETFSAEAAAERQGRCPLQLAGYEVGAIPLFHLLNRPNPSRLRQAIAAGLAEPSRTEGVDETMGLPAAVYPSQGLYRARGERLGRGLTGIFAESPHERFKTAWQV